MTVANAYVRSAEIISKPPSHITNALGALFSCQLVDKDLELLILGTIKIFSSYPY